MVPEEVHIWVGAGWPLCGRLESPSSLSSPLHNAMRLFFYPTVTLSHGFRGTAIQVWGDRGPFVQRQPGFVESWISLCLFGFYNFLIASRTVNFSGLESHADTGCKQRWWLMVLYWREDKRILPKQNRETWKLDRSWGKRALRAPVGATKGDYDIDLLFLFTLGTVLLDSFRGSQAWLGNGITWRV